MDVRRLIIGSALLFGGVAANAQHAQMPAGMTHEKHLEQMQKEAELKGRGAAAMGFDQDRTSHHFRLSPSGGSIAVAANDAADVTSQGQIRSHLREIAGQFAAGVFAAPFATHAEVPPGVAVMQRRAGSISYVYEDAPGGGLVRIETTDRDAIRAVHDFLRYQIREHATGDPLTVGQ